MGIPYLVKNVVTLTLQHDAGLFIALCVIGVWASVEMAHIRALCPGGLGVVNCFVDPCGQAMRTGCHGYPDAMCKSNYCGGCNANWFDANGNEVFCHDKPTTALPTKG